MLNADALGAYLQPENVLAAVREAFVLHCFQSRQIDESQWAPETPRVEVGDLFTGKARLERRQSDITLFDMTGLALQDLPVARLIHEKARREGAGIAII